MATRPPAFGSLSHLPSPSKTMLNKQAMKDYVYFSDNTKGQAGKAVRIKIDLFPRFAALVDPKTHKGQTIIRQIENLQMANGASAGVYSNANCAFRYMLQVPGLKVFYTVLDGLGQSGKEIFIGDIKPNFDDDSAKAGLYIFKVGSGRHHWYDQTNLNEKFVYINSSCGRFDEALNRASAQVTSDKNSLALFYVPGRVVNELGVWGSGVRSHYKEAVKSLIQVMKFNRENKVGWIAEAEGADMLSGALGKLSGSFARHRFRLIDPLTNTPLLLQKLKEKEIQPARDEAAPVVYSGSNRAANIYMEAQKEAVVHALKMLRVKGLAIEPHQAAVAELESGGDPASPRSQRALANTGALSHSFPGPKVNTNRSLLSFITALKRV